MFILSNCFNYYKTTSPYKSQSFIKIDKNSEYKYSVFIKTKWGFIMSEMKDVLRSLRTSAGYSQKELAELAKVKQPQIARIELGSNDPSCKMLRWYAEYFDVSMDYIFGRTDKPQGKIYNYEPDVLKSKLADKEEWERFVKACFEPNSALNAKLQEAILRLSTGGEKDE